MHENNNSTSINFNTNENDKKQQHHQTVRFLPELKNGKTNRTITLAESEESIISESSYDRYAPANGFFEHAVVNFKKICVFCIANQNFFCALA